MKNKKRLTFFLLMILSIIAIGLIKRSFQNDTFYTIKIGESIFKNGIDMLDHFSFHTLMYTYPHWLYDIIIYLIYATSGFTGLYISSIVLMILLNFCVYRCTYKITESSAAAFVSTLICMVVISGPFITARAQSVSYILFTLEMLFIESFIKTKKNRYIVGLFIISLLICNMHVAVWPFYYILFLPYIAEGIISFLIQKSKSKNKFIKHLKKKLVISDEIPVKKLLLVMIISLITGFLTPIKTTPYTYFIKTAMGNSQKYILEHKMITLKDSIFMIILVLETIFLALLTKIRLRDLFLILGISFMAIVSSRHLGLLAIFGSICFVNTFIYFIETITDDLENIFTNFFSKKIVIIISLIISLVSLFLLFNYQSKKDYVDKSFYPVAAVKYIKDNIDISEMRIFNEYAFGSYLIYNNIPVFIDSRADLYTKQFSGYDYDIFDDYMIACSNDKAYENIFETYKITHILIYKENHLHDMLKINDNYKIVYEDDDFVFYERLNQKLIKISK